MESLNRERGTARAKVTRKCQVLTQQVSEGKPIELVENSFEEIKQSFHELEEKHETIIKYLVNCDLEVDEFNKEINVQEDYMIQAEKLKSQAYEELLSARKKVVVNTDKLRVKVKPIEPPCFSGDIRQYPTFRNNYEKIMTESYGKCAFALYQCLSGEALKVVHGVEDDYEQMFRRLDQRYADPNRISDCIIDQLKRLKPIPEGNNGKFIETVEVIERGWIDMQRNGLEEQMSTVFVISLIEKILPPQKREWIKRYQNLTNKVDAFSDLMKYLIQERELLEYMDKDVRCGGQNSKTAIHNVEVNEVEENLLANAIQKLQNQQAEYQANIESLLHKMSQIIVDQRTEQPPKYDRKICWYHNADTHTINQCTAFHSLEPSTKMEVLKRNFICFHCLGKGHGFKDCHEKRTCYVKIDQGKPCGKPHHPKLHGLFHSTRAYEASSHVHKAEKSSLLMIGQVFSKNKSIITLFDPGSTDSLITHSKARELGLRSYPYSITMTTVGNVNEKIYTKLYEVPLVDENGNAWQIQCIGIDEITSEVKPVDMDKISELLDISPLLNLSRPCGKVDLLIGADNCDIIPNVVKTVGKLQLMQGPFGYCVRGSNSELMSRKACYQAKVNHLVINRNLDEIKGETFRNVKIELDEFFSVDHLGTNCRPKCNSCLKCKECNDEKNITIKEEKEMKLILQGLEYDQEQKLWTVHYPWIKDPYLLPNNAGVMIMRLKGLEKRLLKLGEKPSVEYNEQIHDMERRGVARKLSKGEVYQYKGPIHYLSHHEIVKPSSSSTPTRIVFNASSNYNGHILNNYWAKGPNVMNSLFGLLLRFREGKIAYIGDISKMFNSIRLSELDTHVHRFLWREFEDRPPDHYILTAVPFGDICSPAIAVLAMRQTAEKNRDKFPIASEIIIKESYMDDIIHSTENMEDAIEQMKHIELILKQGQFFIKKWIIGGTSQKDCDVKLINTQEEKVLGIVWNSFKDELTFEVKPRFPTKVNCNNNSLDITGAKLEIPTKLTKRMVLSSISTLFDPMGYVAPLTLNGKLLMREIVLYKGEDGRKSDWDDPLPKELVEKWYKFVQKMSELETIKIPRCIRKGKPLNATLIIFSDASNLAFSACAYVRLQISEDLFESKLIAAKSRLAPIQTQTIPKLELSSAVLGVRLRDTIMKESSLKFDKVYHLTDSEIVLGQIMKDNLRAGTYVANRVTEINEITSKEDWYWIPSAVNIADILTRPNLNVNMNVDSSWQNGPSFLSLSVLQWPIKVVSVESEETSAINTTIVSKPEIELTLFDIKGFQSYVKLLRVTARILNAFQKRSLMAISEEPTLKDIKVAETLWIKCVQGPLIPNWYNRFKRLGPFIKNEILYVGSRIANWMKNNHNSEAFILLPSLHKFTELCIKSYHDSDHGGIETTLCKIHTKFWIPQARKIIRRIKYKCVICRKLEKEVVGQSMGLVPDERLKPSPPFYNSALDLFGPILIKDTVKGRSKKKVYGLIINCLCTRASYVDVVEGYDADSLITTLRRFIALRGFPHVIYSDCGSQLKLASKQLSCTSKDQEKLAQFGQKGGLEWKFTKSADAPWENGCSEAMVKLVKRALVRVIGNAILTFGELQSILFEVANLMNERPIGMKPGSKNVVGSYLCPNDLLLGRASVKNPEGTFTNEVGLKTRQHFINQIVQSFWKKWMTFYFPTLIVRQKWHWEKRNLNVGDIVLIQDNNIIKGAWKLGEVCKVLPSSDGKVRDVEVRYKVQAENGKYVGKQDLKVNRSVHKLVLILPIEEQ